MDFIMMIGGCFIMWGIFKIFIKIENWLLACYESNPVARAAIQVGGLLSAASLIKDVLKDKDKK